MVCLIEDLEIYKKAYQLILKIYTITKNFPTDEKFGLISQMRRCSVSICANMSEGGARITDGEQKHFFGMARGSASELRLFIQLSSDLHLINCERYNDITNIINQIHSG